MVYPNLNREEIFSNPTQALTGDVPRAAWFGMKRGKDQGGKTRGNEVLDDRHWKSPQHGLAECNVVLCQRGVMTQV